VKVRVAFLASGPLLEKELANYFYSVYNVLQMNTLEAMYEQSIISKDL